MDVPFPKSRGKIVEALQFIPQDLARNLTKEQIAPQTFEKRNGSANRNDNSKEETKASECSIQMVTLP